MMIVDVTGLRSQFFFSLSNRLYIIVIVSRNRPIQVFKNSTTGMVQ